MSSSSVSVRPTSGPRSSAPKASVSRGSARLRVSAIRSWISWRRKKPLPAWVETGIANSSSASSNRQSSVPTGASSAMSPKRHALISPV